VRADEKLTAFMELESAIESVDLLMSVFRKSAGLILARLFPSITAWARLLRMGNFPDWDWRKCVPRLQGPTHKVEFGRTIPRVDAPSELPGKLQLRVNAEQRTGRWRFRNEVADETILGADLHMTGGAAGAVNEYRPNGGGEWISHR
jgi:hypothetical protein